MFRVSSESARSRRQGHSLFLGERMELMELQRQALVTTGPSYLWQVPNWWWEGSSFLWLLGPLTTWGTHPSNPSLLGPSGHIWASRGATLVSGSPAPQCSASKQNTLLFLKVAHGLPRVLGTAPTQLRMTTGAQTLPQALGFVPRALFSFPVRVSRPFVVTQGGRQAQSWRVWPEMGHPDDSGLRAHQSTEVQRASVGTMASPTLPVAPVVLRLLLLPGHPGPGVQGPLGEVHSGGSGPPWTLLNAPVHPCSSSQKVLSVLSGSLGVCGKPGQGLPVVD